MAQSWGNLIDSGGYFGGSHLGDIEQLNTDLCI